jgi:hypothetical protein
MMSGMRCVGCDCPDAKTRTRSCSHTTHHLGLTTERDLRASIGSAVQPVSVATTLSMEERGILSGILPDLLMQKQH